MLKAFSPGRVGGLRFLTAYLLSGDDTNEKYLEWRGCDTEADNEDAEIEFCAWYERTFKVSDFDKARLMRFLSDGRRQANSRLLSTA